MSKFKLILAVSADGFLASGPDDDMRWTGPTDKFLFKLLTSSDHGRVIVGRKTSESLPDLKYRERTTVSNDPRHGLSLWTVADLYPGAWLIGGPQLAESALEQGLVGRAYICHNPHRLGSGIPFAPIAGYLGKPDFVGVCNDVRLHVHWGVDNGA